MPNGVRDSIELSTFEEFSKQMDLAIDSQATGFGVP